MKTNFVKLVLAIFIFIGILLPGCNLKDNLKFRILVETTENGIKLTSEEGCAFKELSFTLMEGQSQSIDQFGMNTEQRAEKNKDKNLADFLFSIIKTKEGISLFGIKGTSWKELSFSCPESGCKQLIDENGMAD